MSRQCMVTGKKRIVGNNRSHAENKTKRTFEVNVHDTTIYSELLKRKISVKISAAGLRRHPDPKHGSGPEWHPRLYRRFRRLCHRG